jgi:hypothetical protein
MIVQLYYYYCCLNTNLLELTLLRIWEFSLILNYGGKEGWLDRSGNFGCPSPGDTVAAVLQGRDELSSATTEKLLRIVSVIIK